MEEGKGKRKGREQAERVNKLRKGKGKGKGASGGREHEEWKEEDLRNVRSGEIDYQSQFSCPGINTDNSDICNRAPGYLVFGWNQHFVCDPKCLDENKI